MFKKKYTYLFSNRSSCMYFCTFKSLKHELLPNTHNIYALLRQPISRSATIWADCPEENKSKIYDVFGLLWPSYEKADLNLTSLWFCLNIFVFFTCSFKCTCYMLNWITQSLSSLVNIYVECDHTCYGHNKLVKSVVRSTYDVCINMYFTQMHL